MKVPKIIYVGPYDYEVEVTKSLGSLYGETDNTNSVIQLHPKQSPANKRDTLLHEVLHAIFYSSGASKTLDFDGEAEERVIRALTPWIVQVIRDNPEMVEYLTA